MHSFSHSLWRATIAAVAAISLVGSTFARGRTVPFWGAFYCNAEPTPGNFIVIDDPDSDEDVVLPGTLDVIVAGAGHVNNMRGPVVCYSDDEHLEMFVMSPEGPKFVGVGGLTSIVRDRNGDTIALKLDMYLDETSAAPGHAVSFQGTFEVIGGTGRFAGVKGGGGIWNGWANDPDIPQANPSAKPSGPGFWQFWGALVFEDGGKTRCER